MKKTRRKMSGEEYIYAKGRYRKYRQLVSGAFINDTNDKHDTLP